MRVSIELVPRSAEDLASQLELVTHAFPTVDTVNVPDLLRFPLRSWDACGQARAFVPHAIPHLRAMDVDLRRPLAASDCIRRHDLREVLVISGDAPVDMAHPVFDATVQQVIRKIKADHPGLKVYAAFDPYRQSLGRERDYALAKLEAGADGLFTQPFFDRRFLEVVADALEGIDVFWGFTSVVGRRSARYWQRRNAAFFPRDFEPTLAWSRRMAREALAFAAERDAALYFMPIRVDARAYLEGILGREAQPSASSAGSTA